MLLILLFISITASQAAWIPEWSQEMKSVITGLHYYGQKNKVLVTLKEGSLLSMSLPKREQKLLAQTKLPSGMVAGFGESIYWVLDHKLYEVKGGTPILVDGARSAYWRWNEKGKAFVDSSRGSFQLWEDLYTLSDKGVEKNGNPTGDLCKKCDQLFRWSSGGWLSRKGKSIVFFDGKTEKELLRLSENISVFTVVYSREVKDILLLVAEGKFLRAFRSQDGKI